MIFEFEGYKIEAKVSNREMKKSKSTGNELEIIDISFQTHQRFKKPSVLFSDDKKWKLVTSSYSYIEGSSITQYNWHLEELEKSQIEKLIINGSEFEPLLYKEEIHEREGNGLWIDIFIETDVQNINQIKDIPNGGYFPVIRQGISDEEKEMRFGRTIWQKEGNKILFKTTLIEKIYDENSKSMPFFLNPDIPNIKRSIYNTSESVNQIFSVLVDKNIITNEEREKIETIERTEFDSIIFKAFNKFNKAKNIKEFINKEDFKD
ncbi:MAG: hypothetical protein Q8N97_05280 [Methanobacteriaceae archaeon]|nr:hypothetical protein [Methanobacteriaceae archaeon]